MTSSKKNDDGEIQIKLAEEYDEEENDISRETWDKKIDFLLSVIGFCIDLANIWRFPYLCYRNGGGTFLIPYILMLILGGIPLFYMELALGQYNRTGAVTVWSKVCPIFKGIGFAVLLIAMYVDFYYNVIISWSLMYFIASFRSVLPWSNCNNAWNTLNCFDPKIGPENMVELSCYNDSFYYDDDDSSPLVGQVWEETINSTTCIYVNRSESSAVQYFERAVMQLHETNGVEDLGSIQWENALALLAVYLICYFSLFRGIKTSGKVVWFTALFPYLTLTVLMAYGATLPGASLGIKYYMSPEWDRLGDPQVWVDAATQVFFSLGPGFGVLLAYSSYNNFRNNIFRDALVCSTINCLTSFVSGFVIFSVLGYMSERQGVDIADVATDGPGLVFVVYPEALSTMPVAPLWSVLFFLMLLTLGLDSSFGGSEAVLTGLADQFPNFIKPNRAKFLGVLFAAYYLIGLASCTQGGVYVVQLLDAYSASYSILFACFWEAVAISWFYGIKRFSMDIKEMLGTPPGIYWKACWMVAGPAFIIFNFVYGLVGYQSLVYEGYVYPLWANILGWIISGSSMVCVPAYACFLILITPGSISERLEKCCQPSGHRRELDQKKGELEFKDMNVGTDRI